MLGKCVALQMAAARALGRVLGTNEFKARICVYFRANGAALFIGLYQEAQL
jgi:hypothetical protein